MNSSRHIEAPGYRAVGIDEKVAALRQPATYPFHVGPIQVKETHMSWVFLAGALVYKLKKPVRYSFLDHRTLDSRLRNSREEIRINQRLGQDIYLGIEPLVRTDTGALRLEGQGEIVDWLVKMKRVPDEEMLDYAILHNAVDEHRLRQAIELLTEFYKHSPPAPVSPSAFIEKLEADIRSNGEQLANPLYQLPVNLVRELTAGQLAFVASHQELLEKRVLTKRVIDAHGDLRPEHICLSLVPVIIDRLEFSQALRIMDIAEELSFLSLECEMLGNTHVGRLFTEMYANSCHDEITKPLMNFYKIKKACTRAYLVARHIEESRYKDDPKWLAKANGYLKIAEKYFQQLAA